jgi:hypothetical protein
MLCHLQPFCPSELRTVTGVHALDLYFLLQKRDVGPYDPLPLCTDDADYFRYGSRISGISRFLETEEPTAGGNLFRASQKLVTICTHHKRRKHITGSS